MNQAQVMLIHTKTPCSNLESKIAIVLYISTSDTEWLLKFTFIPATL